jgi:hypothetical protein
MGGEEGGKRVRGSGRQRNVGRGAGRGPPSLSSSSQGPWTHLADLHLAALELGVVEVGDGVVGLVDGGELDDAA